MNLFETTRLDEDSVLLKINVEAVDDDVAVKLREKLYEILDNNASSITISLGNVNELGSAAIGKLLYFYKKFKDVGGKLKVIDLSDEIRDTFEYLRLDVLFDLD